MTDDHLLFVRGYPHSIPASHVKVGDELNWLSDNTSNKSSAVNFVRVKEVRRVVRKGSYAPFTTSGTIVVNQVLASTFVGFQDSGVLKVGSYFTPLAWQTLAHVFESPHRLVCATPLLWTYWCVTESYSIEGISHWVYGPLTFTMWLLGGAEGSEFSPSSSSSSSASILLTVLFVVVIMVPISMAFVLLRCLEMIGLQSVVIATLGYLYYNVYSFGRKKFVTNQL